MFVSAVRKKYTITLKTRFESSESFDACSNAIYHIMTILVSKVKYYSNKLVSQKHL